MPPMAWQRCVRPRRSEEGVPARLPSRPLTEASHLVKFQNVRLATPAGLINGELWMQHGKIVNPESRFWQRESSAADRRIDCRGMIIAPGFIDLQLQKACGVDFSALGREGTEAAAEAEQAIQRVCKALPAFGVTSFCPMIRPSDPASYPRLRTRLRPSRASTAASSADGLTTPAATLLGLHLDGPFLSTEYVAEGHDRARILPSFAAGPRGEPDNLTSVYGPLDADGPPLPAIVTLAPELPGSLAAVRQLRAAGVVVGLGRTAANLAACRCAVNAGATLLTNLLDSMLPFHHRDPGPMGLLVGNEGAEDEVATQAAPSLPDAQATEVATRGEPIAGGVFYSIVLDCSRSHPNSVRSQLPFV